MSVRRDCDQGTGDLHTSSSSIQLGPGQAGRSTSQPLRLNHLHTKFEPVLDIPQHGRGIPEERAASSDEHGRQQVYVSSACF